jgi:predicted DNA-binding ribbon-helix-helix protein
MQSAIVKRSIVLNGHKTSVSLEDEFWRGLRDIAEREKTNLSALAGKIDAERHHSNLSSAIRVYVFNYFRVPTSAAPAPPVGSQRSGSIERAGRLRPPNRSGASRAASSISPHRGTLWSRTG